VALKLSWRSNYSKHSSTSRANVS